MSSTVSVGLPSASSSTGLHHGAAALVPVGHDVLGRDVLRKRRLGYFEREFALGTFVLTAGFVDRPEIGVVPDVLQQVERYAALGLDDRHTAVEGRVQRIVGGSDRIGVLGEQVVVARRLVGGDQLDRLVADFLPAVRNFEITLVGRLQLRAVGLECLARAGHDGRFERITHVGELSQIVVGFAVGSPEFVALHQFDDHVGIVVGNLVGHFAVRSDDPVGVDRTVLLGGSQHDGLHVGARRHEVHVIRNHIGRIVVPGLRVVGFLYAQRNAVRNLTREEVGGEIGGKRRHDEAAVARLVGLDLLNIQRRHRSARLHLFHFQREHLGLGGIGGHELSGSLDGRNAEGHLHRTVRQQNGLLALGGIVERVDRRLVIVVSRNIDETLDTAQELIHVHAQAVDEVFQILHRPLILTGDILNRIGNGLIDRAVVGERLADAVLHALREGGVRLVVFDLGIFERFEPALDVGQRTVGVGLAAEGIDLLLQILDFEIEHILLDEVIFRQDRLHRFAQRVLHRRLALADRLL